MLTLLFLLFSRLSTPGSDPHLDDDQDEARQISEIRQMSGEIMAQLRSSPLATPTLNRLMAVLEQTTH